MGSPHNLQDASRAMGPHLSHPWQPQQNASQQLENPPAQLRLLSMEGERSVPLVCGTSCPRYGRLWAPPNSRHRRLVSGSRERERGLHEDDRRHNKRAHNTPRASVHQRTVHRVILGQINRNTSNHENLPPPPIKGEGGNKPSVRQGVTATPEGCALCVRMSRYPTPRAWAQPPARQFSRVKI